MLGFCKWIARAWRASGHFTLNSYPIRSAVIVSPEVHNEIMQLRNLNSFESYFTQNKATIAPESLSMFTSKVYENYMQNEEEFNEAERQRFNQIFKESLETMYKNKEALEESDNLITCVQAASFLIDDPKSVNILKEVEEKLSTKANELVPHVLAGVIEIYGRVGIVPSNLLMGLETRLESMANHEVFALINSLILLKHMDAKLLNSLFIKLKSLSANFKTRDAARALTMLLDARENCLLNDKDPEDWNYRDHAKFYMTIISSTFLKHSRHF